MGLLKKIFNKKKETPKETAKPKPVTKNNVTPKKETPKETPNYVKPIIREASNPDLEKLIDDETKLHDKLWDNNYYGSEESKLDAKDFKAKEKKYLEDNPKDYIVRGAKLSGILLEYTKRVPKDELEIIELLGKGDYYEEMGQYEEAIATYKEADKLTGIVLRDEIAKLVSEHGEGDYLYQAKARNRIRVCENTIKRNEIKELEAEAKALSETNPAEAIKKYEYLNKVNPNLKKYDKAIFKIYEAEAKELEKTNPAEAIKKYEYLNIINPNLKKYNKRIEILKKKL